MAAQDDMAAVSQDLSDLTGARVAFEHARRILEKFGPAEHPHIARGRENLRAVVHRR